MFHAYLASFLVQTAQAPCLETESPTVGPAHATSINKQDNPPQTHPQAKMI